MHDLEFKSTANITYQLQNLLTNKTFQPVARANADIPFEEQPLITDAPNQQYEFVKVKPNTYLNKLKGTLVCNSPLLYF